MIPEVVYSYPIITIVESEEDDNYRTLIDLELTDSDIRNLELQ